MKKFSMLFIAFIIAMIMCLTACTPEVAETDTLWENATYTEDKEFGEGSKTVTVLVQAGEKTVKFTIKTDAEFLGDALIANNLVVGHEGDYGLMIDKVNGIQAIYAKDNAYWALYSRGEYAMTGVDTTPIADGDQYELVYTKA